MHNTEFVSPCSSCALCFLSFTALSQSTLVPALSPRRNYRQASSCARWVPTFSSRPLSLSGELCLFCWVSPIQHRPLSDERILANGDLATIRFGDDLCGSVDCESFFGCLYVADGPSHRLLPVGVLYAERTFVKVWPLLSGLYIF